MDRRKFLSRAIQDSFLAAGTCGLTGCGTLLHSERVGQPHSRDIDWKIVALDGLGLLFFFVPGVVAFAVDFYTGAIYLPHECDYGPYPAYPPPGQIPPAAHPPTVHPHAGAPAGGIPTVPYSPGGTSGDGISAPPRFGFHRLRVPRERLDRRRIQMAVTNQIRRRIFLLDPEVRVSPLADLEQFATVHRQHLADVNYGQSSVEFFAEAEA